MEKAHYYFDMPKETYDFIIKKGILKESLKEKSTNRIMRCAWKIQ